MYENRARTSWQEASQDASPSVDLGFASTPSASRSALLAMPSIGTLLPRRQLYLLAGLAAGLLLLATATYQRDRLPTSSQPWCTNDQLSTGQWEPIKVDGHTWPRLKQSVGYLCADRNHALHCFEEEPTQLPRLAQANSWRWKPDGCALRPFDTDALVDKLGANARRGAKGSGILFVGDSLQLQQVQSFECLMGEHVEEGYISDYEIGSLKLEKGAGKVEFVR